MNLSDTFEQLSLAEVQDYIKRGQEEHLQLDFKTIKAASLASADDRRNFAKSLSGFANSGGGMIVWGIDARRNAEGIDCAVAALEIKQLKMLLSRLNEFTGQAVSPTVEGVRHKMIETSEDTGFAATLVPESQSGPHMAKLGEDRYYKRSGASFYKMEHFDLEDMFGRRQKAILRLEFKHAIVADVDHLSLLIQNVGRAPARHSGFVLELSNVSLKQVEGSLNNASSVNNVPVVTYDNNVGVIHPNGIKVHIGVAQLQRIVADKDIGIIATLYWEGSQSVRSSYVIPPA
jgi:hypothetical protein